MLAGPNRFDPFNGLSFVELNKRRRGEYDRQPGQRIYDHTYKPKVERIWIRRNGDQYNKPKLFIWRLWQSAQLRDLVEEAGNHLGMYEPPAEVIWNADGRQITHPDQIVEGATYVVGTGLEPFDGRHLDATLTTRQPNGHATLPPIHRQNQRGHSFPRPEMSDDFQQVYSMEAPFEPPEIASPRRANKSFQDEPPAGFDYDIDLISGPHTYPQTSHRAETEEIIRDIEGLNMRDSRMLQQHRQRYGGRRARSAMIFNRKDQTNPDAYIIYTFLNGHGLESQHIHFSRKQLEKGMKYVLELVARRFNVKPAKLVNMDGMRIREVNELMSRGSYVLVPVGQTFRETWYFLPDNAIDTSSDVGKVRNRSAQRDRFIQKQNKRMERQTKLRRARNSRGVHPMHGNGRTAASLPVPQAVPGGYRQRSRSQEIPPRY